VKKMIFVNLPVSDLARSVSFYKAIGFTKNEMFSNDQGVAMVWSDEIWLMLLTHDFFLKFTNGRGIADTTKTSEVLNTLSMDSKEAVDDLASQVAANGGKIFPAPVIEGAEGMYEADFTDPDGHIWELVYMEM